MMSATIGNFGVFNKSLGLAEVQSLRVPSRFTPKERPIHVLDAPAMNSRSGESAYNLQAKSIADFIKSYPDDWSGIIHVTRKTEARLLAGRLARHGLAARLWVPPETDPSTGRRYGTQDQVALWHARRAAKPNSIMIAWQYWEGYDGRDERICIVAKVPYPYLGDAYEKARMDFDRAQYGHRTARQIAQGFGRSRRGRYFDYDVEGQVNGAVAVADMNIMRILGYLPVDVCQALTSPDSTVMAKIAKSLKRRERKAAKEKAA